uniref:Fatty acyl-CoA reductase n=1 Tax=Cuerna arida TaxID=1464854 RepID=A0A1B6FNL1_9HEMI
MEENPYDLSALPMLSLDLCTNTIGATRPIFPSKQQDLKIKLNYQDPLQILGEKSFGKPKETRVEEIGTPVQEFFRNSHVFITGGTGFVGKVLTEKLIRSIPHLGQIYLLIRTKRGKTAQERFDKMFEDKVFLRMKTEVPDYLSKVSFVDGDISEPDLGLSETDRQMLSDNINIVFHSAADVRFIEPLRVAVESNLHGCERVLALAKRMKNLKSYVHVSTAYSFCVERIIPEEVPKMSVSREYILQLLENMNDEEIQEDIERIMQGWPNTYVFSKALCEDMIQDECKGMPICIYRPSVVGPTYREPIRGWTDNVHGPFGILIGIGMGFLHCFLANEELNLDIVPVDLVVNGMIAAAWETGSFRIPNLRVYNFTASSELKVTWKTMMAYNDRYSQDFPCSQAIWHSSFFLTTSTFVDECCHIFLHKIPGMFFDKLAVISGQKPRLMKIYKSIDAVKSQMHYFLFRVWEFQNDNMMSLRNVLSDGDKALFACDVRNVSIEEYFVVGKLGIRNYYLKDKLENIPSAKLKNKWLYWAHNGLKLFSGLVLLKLLVFTAHVLPI